jgi:hypothetical protein
MSEGLANPLVSSALRGADELNLELDSSYLFSYSIEDRSRLAPGWMQRHQSTRFIELLPVENDRSAFQWRGDQTDTNVRLRSEQDMRAFVAGVRRGVVYLDITGLPHFVWMPVIRALLRHRVDLRVVYSEPGEYVPGLAAPGAERYELSDRVSSAEPIPGFASLERETEKPALVALLGFEGGRFARVQERVQTDAKLTFPIVGIPGFELYYPFITYFANRDSLFDGLALANVTFAQANCPFSLLYALEDLERHVLPSHGIVKIATIGTKPHSLGALLYYLRSERSVELIYDHPVRSAGRTKGAGRCWIYPLSLIDYRTERLSP